MSQSVITGSDSTPVYRVRKIGPGTSRTLWPKVSLISRRNLRTSFFWVSSILSSGSGLLSARGSFCSGRPGIAIVRPVQQSSI